MTQSEQKIADLLHLYSSIGEKLASLGDVYLSTHQQEVIGHIRHGFPLSDDNKLMDGIEVWKALKHVDKQDMFVFGRKMYARFNGRMYVSDGGEFTLVTCSPEGWIDALSDTCP